MLGDGRVDHDLLVGMPRQRRLNSTDNVAGQDQVRYGRYVVAFLQVAFAEMKIRDDLAGVGRNFH